MSNLKSIFTKSILLVFLLSIASDLYSQLPQISRDWEQIAFNQFEKVEDTSLQDYDYSSIISNQLRMDRDPWSTYVGVLGPNNQRIDFHITVFKSINKNTYSLKGKSKLGNNIRDLTGEIKIKNTLKMPKGVFMMLFEYDFKEPGNKDGDGQFIGIGSFVFTIQNYY